MSSKLVQLDAVQWFLHRTDICSQDTEVLIYGAEEHPLLDSLGVSRVRFIQSDYQKASILTKRGFQEDDGAFTPETIIINGERSRSYTELLISEAAQRVSPSGQVLICLGSKSGGDALAKRCAQHVATEIESKHRCKLILLTADQAKVFSAHLDPLPSSLVVTHRGIPFTTHPALFSWQEVDEGTLLLEGVLQETGACVTGMGADFGCGWGALGVSLLKEHPTIESITFVDSDRWAIASVESTLKAVHLQARGHTVWGDVSQWKERSFDWIVSNVPYHSGGDTDYSMQLHFVRGVLRGLRPGGAAFLLWHHVKPEVLKGCEGVTSIEVLAQSQPYSVLKLRGR